MKIYHRENYLNRIRGFYHDTGMIKVITGIRRCGKSCLMKSIAEELEQGGVDAASIFYINLDKRGYKSIKTPEQLENLIDNMCCQTDGVKYLFIDEIQNVENFEEVVNAFREEEDYSIFITGSNSYLLSGELVTKLTGRYLEFEVYPLTFDEYLDMKAFLGKPVDDVAVEFEKYIIEGGFPKTLDYPNLPDKREYVKGVIKEIFDKDIKRRVKVRNVSTFNTVQTYIINNFGATTSLTNILEDLHKAGSDITRETLNRYIQILIDAKILYKCERFDLKSRRSIAGEQKYYIADLGFYFSVNTDNRVHYGPVLENITYLYAKSKGYMVSVGRVGKLECDFILQKDAMQYSYVQVAMTIQNSRETEDREYAPLESIRDNYPKYVMTRNDLIQHRNGIIHVNIGPFMKEGQMF